MDEKRLAGVVLPLVQAFPDNSIIARNGGDEFCIILKDCSAEEAAPMIDAFSKASRSFSAKGAEHNYSISLGYAEYPPRPALSSNGP